MTLSKLYLTFLVLATLFIVTDQKAVTNFVLDANAPVLEEYEGYSYYKGYSNNKMASLIMRNSTINVEIMDVQYLNSIMNRCKEFMDFTGKKLTQVSIVDESVIKELKAFHLENCY